MKAVGEFLYRVIVALNDTDNMDPKAQRTWRRAIAAAVTTILVVLAVGFAWAQGWIPGASGVALASDLSSFKASVEQRQTALETKQDRLALLIVKGALKIALNDRCVAINRKNQQALDAANTSIDDLTEQYRELNRGREPSLLDCSVVLIDADRTQPPR